MRSHLQSLPEAAHPQPFTTPPPSPSGRLGYSICGRILFAASFALITSTLSLGQSSNFTTLVSRADSAIEDIAIDSTGVIYAAGGNVLLDGSTKGVIRRSDDHGATWTDLVATDPRDEYIERIAVSGTRVLALSCNLSVSDQGNDPVRVLQSIDGGPLTVVTEYVDPYKTNYSDIAVDSTGNIYLAGTAKVPVTVVVKRRTTTELRNAWVVSRIGLNGTATTTALPETAVGTFVGCSSVLCVGDSVYLGGTSDSRWDVRRSDNGGTSWTRIDSYRYDENRWSYVTSLAAGPDGSVYALGSVSRLVRVGSTTTALYSWFVRKNSGGATAFAPVNGFTATWVNSDDPKSIVVDIYGGIHVTGHGTFTNDWLGDRRWITRSFSKVTGLWETSEDLAGRARALATDAFGRVYSAGRLESSNTGWAIRGPALE